jgi:copper homeostasis protein CutC
MAGDSRSGEMIVFSPGETVAVERSLLLLRQLRPDDHWSVIGAINPAMTIDVPASGAIVPSGPIAVTGHARGFEALVVVSAHRVGDTFELIDQRITTAGSLEESEPFRVELDLSDTNHGEVIAIVVRGGVGLENDPGEFSAIPIRMAG